MLAPIYSVADLLSACRGLLPRGRAWSRDPASTLTTFLTAVAAFVTQFTSRAANLLIDAFPASTEELLPEWEASLGLPDPCQGAAPDVVDRRNQVVARFAGSGGQSVPYFINLGLLLGYTISIIEYAPARYGSAHYGDLDYGVDWANAWTVRAPTLTPTFAQYGQSAYGDPYANWGNTVLQCEFARLKPAHTTLNFQYS